MRQNLREPVYRYLRDCQNKTEDASNAASDRDQAWH